MERLSEDLSLDQIDDFFTIGKTPNVQSLPKSITGGRPLDSKTGKPVVSLPPKPFIPPYKRHDRADTEQQKGYAREYQKQEEQQMTQQLSQLYFGQSDSSRASTAGTLEQLEVDSTITGSSSVILPEGKTEEQANEIYKNYNFRHTYDTSLSITKYQQEIVETIENNQVVVIHGPTGSGKTTQVPQYILDSYAQKGSYCNIIVTQPRRIAAISIATRVCHERSWNIGGICGYQVALDNVTTEDTRLLYCTTGVLYEKLIRSRNMNQYTHVILDEVHERDQDSDFCLLVVRRMLRTNSRDVKVILMSATAESKKFAHYFSFPVRGTLEPAPIFSVEGRAFKISEYYLDDLKPLGTLPHIDEDKPDISIEAMKLAIKLIEQFDVIESQERSYGTGSWVKGSVLIFLPGLGEISDMEEKLRQLQEKLKWWVIPLHSSITGDEQALVFRSPVPGQRKIILSTNIAESSITVPDIKYVIDFCLTKQLVSDPETNYTSLQVQWAARSNCIQRMGRAGRVSDGRVYKMITRNFYRQSIPQYGIPEMERCPLDILILKSKRLNMGEPKFILGLALDPPHLDNIEVTILTLKEIGALAPHTRGDYNPHDGDTTFMGEVLATLPVDIRLGKLMILGHVFGMLEDTIIIAASLSLKSFFARPYKSYVDAFKNKLKWADGSYSDCIAYLQAYKTWVFQRENGRFSHIQQELQWGRNFFIQIKRIKEVAELVRELKQRLKNFNILIPHQSARVQRQQSNEKTEDENLLLLKLLFCGAFYPNYFIQDQCDQLEANRQMSGRNPCTTVMVKGLPQNQGAFYKKQLENLFSHCESDISLVPKVAFEETKAFVEFNPDLGKRYSGGVLPAVFVAVKMRQLRIPMTIKLLDNSVASEKMKELAEMQRKRCLELSQLRTNRFETGTPKMTSSASVSGQGRQVDLPSPHTTIVPIFVTEIVQVGHFWGHYGDPDTWKNLCELQRSINNSPNSLIPLSKKHQKPGGLCLAPYTDTSTDYYRAHIETIKKTGGGIVKVKVFFVDYGNSSEVLLSDLKDLHDEFQELPFQSIECQLSGIKPSLIKCPSGRWTEAALRKFANLVSGKANIFAKVYSIVHGVMRVELIEKTQTGSVSIQDVLIQECFADRAEENLTSKQCHDKREWESMLLSRTDVLPDNEEDDKMSIMSEQSSFLSHAKMSASGTELAKGDADNSEWMYLASQESFAEATVNENRKGRTMQLNGPWSMYEMKFHSATYIGSLREVRIDRESVNSVAIDEQPQECSQRLMVAAHVGLNPSGSTVMARDTTIMPDIPGLLGIAALVFCPYAEMRCNKERTCYTGLLCGLGWSKETEGPALPDRDMEIRFTTTFDEEDLQLINGVRMGIFISAGGETTSTDWGDDAIIKLQKSARRKLLSLLQRRREKVEPYFFPRQFEWNCVDPEDLLYPELDGGQGSTPISLHCGIALATVPQDDGVEQATQMHFQQFWLKLHEHMKWLHTMAGPGTMRKEIECQLCQVQLLTPRELSAHLSVREHITREAEVKHKLGII